jgi:hypothetical protein
MTDADRKDKFKKKIRSLFEKAPQKLLKRILKEL